MPLIDQLLVIIALKLVLVCTSPINRSLQRVNAACVVARRVVAQAQCVITTSRGLGNEEAAIVRRRDGITDDDLNRQVVLALEGVSSVDHPQVFAAIEIQRRTAVPNVGISDKRRCSHHLVDITTVARCIPQVDPTRRRRIVLGHDIHGLVPGTRPNSLRPLDRIGRSWEIGVGIGIPQVEGIDPRIDDWSREVESNTAEARIVAEDGLDHVHRDLVQPVGIGRDPDVGARAILDVVRGVQVHQVKRQNLVRHQNWEVLHGPRAGCVVDR